MGCAVLVVAQPSGPALPATVTLSEQVDLARLVDLAAQRLKMNLEYDSSQLKGTVTLRLGAGISDQELWHLTNRLLATRGFTTIRTPGHDNVLSVVRVDAASGLARVEPALGYDAVPAAPSAGFVIVSRELLHRTTKEKDFLDAVRQVLSKSSGGGTSGSVGGNLNVLGTDRILIADLSGRVEQALALIALLDTPSVG